ncbi:cytochrome P450 [Panus rudis PR-1116 ss-1]|nr:cytochrome P450 [Panus rudis PR-1116 ss-1]
MFRPAAYRTLSHLWMVGTATRPSANHKSLGYISMPLSRWKGFSTKKDEMFWTGFACLLLLSIFAVRKLRSHKLPLPPGPQGYPIIGNLLDLPNAKPWLTFTKWSNTYGDLVYLDLPLKPMIVVGSVNTAIDLLEKRSNIYSDRHITTMTDLSGWEFNLGLMRYSQRWRSRRRLFHQYFNENSFQQWRPIQVEETQKFLRRMLDDPHGIDINTRLLLAASILRIVYGMHIDSTDDDYIQIVREAVHGISLIAVPGRYWVDYFPIVQKFPDWFPGTQWKQVAKDIRGWVDSMRLSPMKDLRNHLKSGSVERCVAAAAIAKARERCQCKTPEEWAIEEEIITDVAGVAYAAGVDTTNSAAQFFYIAMTLYPQVQKSAQAELDAVVGRDRLPSVDDLEKLVYIRAIVWETLRWQVVAPFGIPHRVLRDDEYNGYFIPAGTDVIPNAWAMLHNPEDYPDPMLFKPERYIKNGQIDPNVRDPSTIAFGFGRRICPGRYLANSALSLMVALTLHTFNIEPEGGEPFDPETMIGSGLISFPTKVPAVLRPRSNDAERRVRESCELST